MVSETVNKKWVLKKRPEGYPCLDDFDIVNSPIPDPKHGEVLIKTLYLSLDPYMRGRLRDAKSYASPVGLGEVITGEVVGRVIRSNYQSLEVGDIVTAHIGWQQWGSIPGQMVRKVDSQKPPISTSLGILGMPGLTAYFGLLEIGKPIVGETLVVSAASGAVGAIVGQLGKMMGCRVIGTAGTNQKVNYIVNELGFDGAINYKTQNVESEIHKLCPNGIDIYFDNVGGEVTDIVMNNLAMYARIIICGQISQYNSIGQEQGPRNLWALIRTRSKIQGMLVTDWERKHEQARTRLSEWVLSEKLKYKEYIVEGFEKSPQAFIGLMNGENFGKLLIHVSE
jgi:NADPH-dependent curcumin reductase CurA|tara:strand:- start:369 stop:1382 length:1014 start_codon:yes stop_codon:yes gene_type:complete